MRWLTNAGRQLGFGWNGVRLNVMGTETGKQNWHALLFSSWLRFVYRVSYFPIARVVFLCKYAGLSCESDGRWREE